MDLLVAEDPVGGGDPAAALDLLLGGRVAPQLLEELQDAGLDAGRLHAGHDLGGDREQAGVQPLGDVRRHPDAELLLVHQGMLEAAGAAAAQHGGGQAQGPDGRDGRPVAPAGPAACARPRPCAAPAARATWGAPWAGSARGGARRPAEQPPQGLLDGAQGFRRRCLPPPPARRCPAGRSGCGSRAGPRGRWPAAPRGCRAPAGRRDGDRRGARAPPSPGRPRARCRTWRSLPGSPGARSPPARGRASRVGHAVGLDGQRLGPAVGGEVEVVGGGVVAGEGVVDAPEGLGAAVDLARAEARASP